MSSEIRRLLRDSVYPAVESSWAAVAGVSGAASRIVRSTPRWETDGRQRVAVVAPHPDDETIGAGGAAALHVLAGDSVRFVVVTDGGGSRALQISSDEMARRRRDELDEAAAALGVEDVVWLGLPEWRWRTKDLREPLAAALTDADVVYAPSWVDYNPEHARVARVLAGVLRPHQQVRVCELGVPLTPVLVNLVADLTDVLDRKQRALSAFVSQSASLQGLQRLARYRARYYRLRAAEVFWQMDTAGFALAMARGDWRRGVSPFVGIGPNPLRDPWSLTGLRHRRALARAA